MADAAKEMMGAPSDSGRRRRIPRPGLKVQKITDALSGSYNAEIEKVEKALNLGPYGMLVLPMLRKFFSWTKPPAPPFKNRLPH